MCRCVPFCLGHPMCMLHIWPLKVNLSSHHPSVPRGVDLANRSCVTLSDLCSMQCFRQCTLILKRPIFKALSVSRYRQKAPRQQHMVSSSTSSDHVCMNSERERQSFIDYAYMVKEKQFSWHKLEFLEKTYSQRVFQQQCNQVDGYTEPQIKRGESESCEKEQKRAPSCGAVRKCPCAARWTGPKTNKLKLNHRKMADLHV